MKKIWKLAAGLMLSAGLAISGYAANTCTNTDLVCYQSGPSQSLNTLARIDSSGNQTLAGNSSITGSVSLTGSQTTAGKTIYSPSTSLALSSQSTISPTATYMIVTSTGGNVILGQGSPYVAIATATATNGQILILGSTVALAGASVTLSSGAAAGLDLGAATRTLNYGKRLGLIYDSLTSVWTELFYGSN